MALRKKKYYNLEKTIKNYPDAQYYMIIGERSNGKTYAVLRHGIKKYFEDGSEMAIIRRWADDFKGKRGQTMFDSLMQNGNGENDISILSNGEWDRIYYYSGRWYFARKDENDNLVKSDFPFCYGFAVAAQEHDKSTSYPRIRTVLFDEFLTRVAYLRDEFVLFMNCLSTIIRDRNDVTIFMCGNTINKYSPYFKEMGITNIQNMKQSDIDVYSYGENSTLKVVVEFSDSPQKYKKSNVYFAFDNPKLSMITGKGNVWEIDIYPHCPCKYKPSEIMFCYFIEFNGDLLQCEIILHKQLYFTYIHRKTTPLQDDSKDLIYSADFSPKPNYRRKLTTPTDTIDKKILAFFHRNKVFYQDNEIGEIVRNYLMWSGGIDKTK